MSLSSWFGADGRDTPIEFLWEDGERVFCRTWRNDGARQQCMAVLSATEHPIAGVIDRFTHEYGLKDYLDGAWAVRPLELVRERGHTMLVLESPGGEPLDRLLGLPMEVGRFLRLATALAVALGRLHERGLIHKDIKPANVLVNVDTDQIWLMGFGIASRLPRERQLPEPPEVIAGTLSYMAPEQTGRMNRSIDSRSDLYSLGVTFYRMLTGALPFTAPDPMGWVHCHIARTPVPPRERLENIPPPVSQIVMKLLAKTAEERYQTAAGVEHDLRRCRSEWEIRNRIDEFPLAAQDVPDRLLVPEKLYGRAREVASLLSSFHHVVATGIPELVLVSGYSGIGKSSVVNELHKVLVPPRGLFASGKFDQYHREIPYATLVQAFQSLVRQILSRSEAELHEWRNALHEALGPNGLLMVDLIPELKLVIGTQPPVPELSPQDAQRRFQRVLRRFIGVFARPEHPLALFLDDLQWLDAATLDLLEDLLKQPDIRYLLLIGAYRDNEVTAAHPLMRKLDEIRRAGASVQDIVLSPLIYDDLGHLIAESLSCEPKRASPLVQRVHEKTGGNPFFSIQFLYALADEALLSFDHTDARWTWDLDRIDAKRYTDNVVDLMVVKLNRLPAETQTVLRQLACIGASVQSALLGTVCQLSQEELHASLWEGVRSGLVQRSDNAYTFQHDRIQEAAYSLIPEEARAEAHLRIGRLLVAHTPPGQRDELIFEIVSQFNRSAELITSPEEREQLAQLNLIAGKRAKNAAAYPSALIHFAAGQALLTQECWTLQYPLVFELEYHRAESEFLAGEAASAEERLTALAGRAANLAHQAVVTCLRVELYAVLGRSDSAVAVGLEYLRRNGLDWSPHPADADVLREYERIWQRLGSRPIEDLIDLPPMTDEAALVTMDVLTKLMPATFATDDKLRFLLIIHMVNLSLEYGNCNASCCAYVWLGLILVSYFGNFPEARRFGQLSLDLVEQRGLTTFKNRVHLDVGVFVDPWTKHVRSGRALIQRAAVEANISGDLAYAGFYCSHFVTNSLACGEPLVEVEREATEGRDFGLKADFPLVVDSTQGQICLIRTLRGLTRHFRTFDDANFNEAEFEEHLKDPNLTLPACWYWIRKLQARVFAGDYSSALEAAVNAQTLLWTSPAFFEQAEYHFYAALAQAGSLDMLLAVGPERRAGHLEALVAHHHQLQLWAEHCPENFENRAALIGAERARLEGRDLEAARLYEQAIRSARARGFGHNEALACEVAARFYLSRGFEDIAEMYLLSARNGYLRWGADGKVRHLEVLYPRVVAAKVRGMTRVAAPSEAQVDVAAIVKASQALSSEMLLPRLIERLMSIALQSAGADRGLLILPHQNHYRIEAEARTEGEGVVLRDGNSVDLAAPDSIIRYVMRTQESVILDDAIKRNLFSEDPYLGLRQPRSILCLPLVRQGALGGLLYLENTLASHVFTPDRAKPLELLASQAAISLENTRLYGDLQEREARVRRLFNANIIGIFTWNLSGKVIDANDAFLRIVGYDSDDVASGSVVWRDLMPPEWDPANDPIMDQLLATSMVGPFEGEYIRKDRSRVPVLIGAALFEASPSEGVAFVVDLTDRKRAEELARESERQLHEINMQLAHANRVATMGQLSASIAHEVNQPLSGILTNASTCLRMLTADPPNLDGASETVRRTIRDAKRASEVITRLRALFVKKDFKAEPVDLNEATREVVALSSGDLQSRHVALRLELAGDLPRVTGDRVQLQQVILNLIRNASDAMSAVDDRPRVLVIRTSIAAGDEVHVSVQDAGIGIDPGRIPKLFEPFYSSKSDGMGIGLSISRSIVQSHQGRLWAEPNAGPGATFLFSIPAMRLRASDQ